MRKYLAVAAATCSLLLFAGCGASGGDSDAGSSEPSETTEAKETTTTEAEGDTVSIDEWATTFCDGFSGWLTSIEEISEGVTQADVTDLDSAKTALSDLLGDAADETGKLVTTLEDGGTPDMDDGEGLVDEMISRFESFQTAATDAQAEIEAVSTDDPLAFQQEAEEVFTNFQTEVETVGDSFAEIDEQYPDEEFQTALASACDI